MHEVLKYLPTNEHTDGQLLVLWCILFKLEKPFVEHLEGFILFSRKGGELQIFLKTLNQKFQLKNSIEFPHRISK